MKHVLFKRIGHMALCVMTFLCALQTFGADYTVSSADEFNSLSLSPGDVVTWTNGSYSAEQRINFTANGTASNPITLRAETPGGVIFTGLTNMDISGDYVIIDGFYWNGGAGSNNHIQFRKGSAYANHSTIRNCGFNNLTPSGTDKHRWIVLYGTNNVVENCSFLNKNSPGALVLVELEYNDFNPVGHIIRNNYFYNYIKRDPSTTHSGDSETIRVGTSEFQDKSASVTVEGNYFYKADGENEIITNKSADNTYRNNTFRSCRGSLVMRHGARATVEGNYFLGENVEGTGGIRITDSYHVITNNYFQDLVSAGDKWNNGITLVGGSDTSGGITNGYQKVDGIVVAFNTLYNVDSPIFYNDRSSYDPTGVLAYNVVYTDRTDIVSGDISGTGQGMTYEGNIFGGATIGISDSGISQANANFSASGEIFKPSASGPAANAAGSSYSSTVNNDIEGRTRPNSNMDAGAHEVSGGNGSAIFSPHTNSMVGVSVGASFLDATGNGSSGDYLTVSSVSDFASDGATKTVNVSSNVSWSVSDNQSWITISPTSGSSNGSFSITVSENTSDSDRSGTVTVSGSGVSSQTINVSQEGAASSTINVSSVSLSPSSTSLSIGATQQLSVSLSPSNASNTDVSYSSSNTSVASVNSSGVVTANAAGNATITVTTDDGNHTDTTSVTVNEANTGEGSNLALSGTATQSSVGYGGIPSRAIDGNTAGNWSGGSVTHTSAGTDAWWQVDLGQTQSIGDIVIYNRTDNCCSNRLSNFTVSVIDSNGNTTFSQTVANPPSPSVTINAGDVNGEVVRVSLNGTLSLAEVQVYEGEGSNPTPADAPYDIVKFQDYLAQCKLQSPLSGTEATDAAIIAGYSSNTFYVADGNKLAFYQTRDAEATSQRTELRFLENWYVNDGTQTLHANVNIIEQTCDQLTIMQIHDDANVGSGPNKPLIRIYQTDGRLYAAVKTDSGGVSTSHVDLGATPSGYFDCDITIDSGDMIVELNGSEVLNEDVSFWTFPSYWKNGVYLQDEGEATVYFNELTLTGGGSTTTPDSENVALNKSVTFSEEQSTNPAANLVDGDADSRWSAEGYPEWVVVDLEGLYTINSTEVVCFNDRAYQYTIEASTDGNNYTEVVDRSNNTTGGSNASPIADSFSEIDARYVRITVSGADDYTGDWASIEELRVFGYASSSTSKEGASKVNDASAEAVSLWPNPAINTVNISGADGYDTLTVYDQVGKVILNQPIQGETVDISNFNSGMYIFRLTGKEKVVTKRVIKR
ncbi:chondroitinase-B domain-containing protein [Tamlana sp. 2_MG-2023]|uniref:chondroitinase-B domain-containing protein n=1 Tax=unclassified Tamlana TaxID=2614803 RepID=UPI0026E2013C|nr:MULTISPECIES: chondroitinase-B domain-containing protein [unclassified Tamlana]MDO6760357.1 chondroitinase-B domain-containing protein [Tamlana sp. 2_MG-2023]MDO6789945.1 chondroitinase-B domain-containing protein [Tamlana sp. 1_MG-2023]